MTLSLQKTFSALALAFALATQAGPRIADARPRAPADAGAVHAAQADALIADTAPAARVTLCRVLEGCAAADVRFLRDNHVRVTLDPSVFSGNDAAAQKSLAVYAPQGQGMLLSLRASGDRGMTYGEWNKTAAQAIAALCARLRDNAPACIGVNLYAVKVDGKAGRQDVVKWQTDKDVCRPARRRRWLDK